VTLRSRLDRVARALLDSASDYVAILDSAGGLVDLNPVARQAAARSGVSGSTLVGLPLWQIAPWNATAASAAEVRRCCEQAARGEVVKRLIEVGVGEAAELSLLLVPGEDDEPAHLLAQGRDGPRRTEARDLGRRRSPSFTDLTATQPAPGAPLDVSPSGTLTVPSAPRQRPRVLVVEDNPEMNRFLIEALSRMFDVDSALDGEAGLERALAAPPDLILTDLMMPKMSGDLLLREVRARPALEGVPIVVLTANADDELRVRLLREGAQDFLAKPFSAKELLVRVGNLVDVKRAREVLRAEAASQSRDLETLARTLTTKTRQLASALETAREARERAERAGEAKNLFLSVASHELRTPLAALQLRIDRMRRSGQSTNSPELTETLRGVQGAIDRLTMLVESLVQYANLHSKVLPVFPTAFDAGQPITDVVQTARQSAEVKGLALRFERPDIPVTLNTDPALFRSVIGNLVDNAIKFTDRGEVELSLQGTPDAVTVHVRDTGPGVPAGERSRIFEPFAHLESAEGKHTPGVGLGLAMVREVMHVLGGKVELESEVGVGSTFSVTFLLAGRPPPAND
jgi:signal transduction histidine kinase